MDLCRWLFAGGPAGLLRPLYERVLNREVLRATVPEHVAIIQDGNRRYARAAGVSSFDGHSRGAETTEMVADWCLELGIKHLSVYTFSTENFDRDEAEKEYLFELIERKLLELSTSERVHRRRVRVRAIGRTNLLPKPLQEAIRKADAATRGYDGMYFNLALAYGGKSEIADAARSLALELKEGRLKPRDLNEDAVASHLYPAGGVPLPRVDLIIRTGGEVRTSNFLPWQANGSSAPVHFCSPFWPQFSRVEFLGAIRTFQRSRARLAGSRRNQAGFPRL
ncbi:polyprenyl diphosphate synthase [Methanotrichaceae archaeon Mx]|uniref:Tritrans,polycis-undecaprenyl-diphosphate synthase (geranylgeranyl-diphosphate specific) n=1 Tax=Candidatus Methanocrinis natronophilus TaxID=3033396 RepID=A0ABT5X5G3_9EURY|nr:polyprenyl diphosphate synthase [Candidatus Methanocrinis natronophilus]